jgi:peptidyl-prolyl cis-trans isomerase SurA
MKMVRGSGFGPLAVCCVAAALSVVLCGAAYGEIMLDKVVAVVNSEVITWSELYKSMEFEASPQVKAMSEQQRKKLFSENEAAFLENLINTKLALQAAKTAFVTTSDAEVKQTIENIKAKHNLSDQEFEKAMLKEGFTTAEYKKKLAEQITVSKLIEHEVRKKIVVTDKEVKEFIDKHKDAADEGYEISLIHVKDGPKAEERIAAAYGAIKAGAPFAQVAKEYSEDSSSRMGGSKGFVRRADLSKEFVDAISVLKNGEVSAPFRSASGMNIVKLDYSRVFSKEGDLQAAVRDKLFAMKYERAYKAWIKGLRQTAYVEIR